jgi:hypothetical protein
MPPAIAARIAADACAGVHFAHSQGKEGAPLLHGHLAPASLLVSSSGVTLVAGFGAGVAEAARPARERLPWQSPEQILGGPAAAVRETDVYLLGLVLRACLSGDPPWPGEADLEAAILSRPPVPLAPLGVPAALAEVVERALAKKAQDRYSTAADLGRAIEQAAELAAPGAVAAYLDARLPLGEGTRAARREMVGRALAAATPAATQAPPSPLPTTSPPTLTSTPTAAATVTAPLPPTPAARPPWDAPGPGSEVAASGSGETAPPTLGPPLPPPPVDLVGTADIVADTSVTPPLPLPPDLVTTRDIVGEGSGPFMVERPRALPPQQGRGPAAVLLGAAVAAAGLAIGYGLSQLGGPPASISSSTPPPASSSTPTPASTPTAAATPVPPPASTPTPTPTSTSTATPAPTPNSAKAAPEPPSIDVTADPPAWVFIDGKAAGKAPLTKAVSRGKHKVRLRERTLGIDVTRTVEVRGPHAKVRFAVGKATVTVSAPEGASVFIDGRKVGMDEIRDFEVYAGNHTLLVTLGSVKHTHAFSVRAGESFSYDVSKTEP